MAFRAKTEVRGAPFAYSSAIITHGDPPPRRRIHSPRDARRLPHFRPSRRHRSRSLRTRPAPPPARSPDSTSIASARSPLYASLPPAALAFLQPFDRARHVLIACSGGELLAIARGVVPGATQIAPDIALSGAPNLIAAATAAHPPAQILAPAESVAGAAPIWIALRGGIALPLQGNLANLNKLLHDTEFATLAVQPGDPADFELAAQCPSPDAAQRFEQSLRAIVSLAIATNMRQPAPTGLLQSIRIQRDDRVVHVSLSASPDTLLKLLFPG